MGGIGDWLFGSKDKVKQVATGTKQQQGFHNNILQQLQQSMGQGGGYNLAQQYNQNLLGNGQEAFNNLASPYQQQFNEQVIPGIEERYAGAGALSSSGFGQALGGAASGLQSQLAQLFSQLQGQAAQNEYGQFNQNAQFGLGYKPFENKMKEGSAGFLGPLATGLGTAFGGPLGGMAASGIASLFKRNSGGGMF